MKNLTKKQSRKLRVRKNIFGTKEKPRLSVFRSNRHLYAQLVDDSKGVTLLGYSSQGKKLSGKTKTEKSTSFGEFFSSEIKKKKISRIVFDRGSSKYHGRVKAFADGVRKLDIEF